MIRKRVLPVRLAGGAPGAALAPGATVSLGRDRGEPSAAGRGDRGVGRVLAADGDVVRQRGCRHPLLSPHCALIALPRVLRDGRRHEFDA